MYDTKLHALQCLFEALRERGTLKPGQFEQLTEHLQRLKTAETRQDVEDVLGDIALLFTNASITRQASPRS